RARQQETIFRTLFETNPSSITIQRASDAGFLMVNPAFQHQIGLPLDQILGRTGEELGIKIAADSANTIQTQLQSTGRVDNILAHTRLPNGQEMVSLFSSRHIDFDGQPCILSVALDVTEVKRLQEQMHHVQKLDAIGQLAGGVAHDFNNMLTGILGSAECLSLELDKNQTGREYLDMIIEATRRAADLTRNLLTFARKNRLEMTEIDVHLVITNSVKLLQRTLNKSVKIETSLDNRNPKIRGDASQLMNALINLGINAGHAMPDGGTLKFSTREVMLDEVFCQASSFDLRPGIYIVVSIEDSGTGISPEHLPHIFEPFFTTKEKDKGTGLGLAAVFGTVCQHRGAITVYSEPGNGTIFHVYLPSFGAAHDTDAKPDRDAEAVAFRGS
ncbi:MAG TPA: ATP-binding protein, partial [Candidatus Ozemobacteraceae bacterium]|nr:ATP-binding protein [Candidatus Ozemobacteraceae bacterium]